MPMPSKTSNSSIGKFFTGENDFTIYADCHGLNRAIYSKRINKRPHWGAVQEIQYEQFGADDSYDSEEEQSALGENSAAENVLQDHEGLEVINNQPSDGEEAGANNLGEDYLDLKDLYQGVQSLIQGGDQKIADDVTLTKPGLLPTEAAEPEKQLYEVLQEVEVSAKDGQIFGSKHGYQMPG